MPTPSVKLSADNQLAHVFQLLPAHHFLDVVMNANLMLNVVHKSIAVAGSVPRLVHSVERERHAHASQTIVQFANVQRVTLDHL